MQLTGVHLLLTYQCLLECEHCFVWGGRDAQEGSMTLAQVRSILDQSVELGTVEWIFFEGGEPFLHYPVVLAGARMAQERGFRVGVVTSGYWATSEEDAATSLVPFAGLLDLLQLSDDAHHGGGSGRVEFALRAAEDAGIPASVIRVGAPEDPEPSSLRYRGRAAERLADRATGQEWETADECPFEDLRDPGRVHVDHLGTVQICQGISIGNLFETPLAQICASYDPERHPILGPLLAGGPAELVRRFETPHPSRPADTCHLCYEARRALRERFPETLAPAQVYGAAHSEGGGSVAGQ